MDIVEVMKNHNVRLTVGNRWMVWDDNDSWMVYEHKPYAKKATLLCEAENIEDALEILVKE